MNINTISYWFVEAFSSIKKNIKTFAMSFFIITATLLVIAIAYMIMQNANKALSDYEKKSGKIEVYLEKGLAEEQINSIRSQIQSMEGVGEITYISSFEAYKIADEMGELYTTAIPQDFYPAAIFVTIDEYQKADEIVSSIRQMDGVGKDSDDVIKNEKMEQRVKGAKTLKVLAITILIILGEVSILIMINSIKLVLYARRREISIMKYVGATDTFIKVPFVIEGIIIALVGAIFTLFVSNYVYGAVAGLINSIGIMGELLSGAEVIKSMWLPLCILAIGIGTVGSSMSIKKYLDV